MFSNIIDQNELINSINDAKSQISNPSTPIDIKEQLILNIRQLTCKQANPNIQEIIDSEIMIPIMSLEFQVSDNARLDILWILSNICSGNSKQTEYVINIQGLEFLGRYSYHQNMELSIQALWGLGNIAGDSALRRDQVLKLGCLEDICSLLDRQQKLQDQRTVTWVLSNIVRGNPKPQFQQIKCTIPYFIKQLNHSDTEIIIDTLWGLSYLSDIEQSHQKLLEINFITLMSKFIDFQTQHSKLVPAIRIIGNIASGQEYGVDQIIQNNLIDALIQVYNHTQKKQSIHREILWILSNIAAGTEKQQLYLIQNPFFKQLVQSIFQADLQSNDLKKEFYWTISNLTTNMQPSIILIQYQWVDLWYRNFIQTNFDNQKTTNILVDLFAEGMMNISKYDQSIFQNYHETFVQVAQQLHNEGINLAKMFKFFDALSIQYDALFQRSNQDKLESKFGEMKIEGDSDSSGSQQNNDSSSDSENYHVLNDCEAAMVNEIGELDICKKSSESED